MKRTELHRKDCKSCCVLEQDAMKKNSVEDIPNWPYSDDILCPEGREIRDQEFILSSVRLLKSAGCATDLLILFNLIATIAVLIYVVTRK